jgi:cysteine desulfurase
MTSKQKKSKIIYLDNNGTTAMYTKAVKVMEEWLKRPINSSAANEDAKKANILIDNSIKLFKVLNFTSTHTPIFTSGASESNNLIIRSLVDTWHYLKTANIKSSSPYINETLKLERPRIISSCVEHSSVLECLKDLSKLKRIDLTLIQPDIYGKVDKEKVKKVLEIRTGIILFTFIFANNELGVMNDISEIMTMVKTFNKDIVTHSDAVQIYGKMRLNLPGLNLDACSVSFHKLYGPIGIGMLMLNDYIHTIYGGHLLGQISGKQQGEFRGGTFSVANIAAAATATSLTFENRQEKNKHLLDMKNHIVNTLNDTYGIVSYLEVLDEKYDKEKMQICILGTNVKIDEKKNITYEPKCLINTILLSIIEPNYEFCNVKFKAALLKAGIVVSIGSACNTSSKSASHILTEIKAPPIVKRGVLRISLGDNNTTAEIKDFCKKFIKLLQVRYIKDV